MSKTIEEIRKELELKYSFALIGSQALIADEVAESYAQSQTQELKEQNAELVNFLQFLSRKGGLGLDVHEKIDNLLTKHNHLNKM